MSNLSRGLHARLAADFTLGRLAPVFVADAADGTRKLLFHLPGEGAARPAAIESVLIPQFEREAGARDRLTLCISSQAGCGMGCGFCATARMGLVRNLSPAEIVGQVRAGRALAAPRPLTNIVFMGMGEPLANYEAVRTALDILTAEWGYAISPRRITVSTVGLVPVIRRLIAETRVNLAVSLSATTDPPRAGAPAPQAHHLRVRHAGRRERRRGGRPSARAPPARAPRQGEPDPVQSVPGGGLRHEPARADRALPGDPARPRRARDHPREPGAGHPGRLRAARRGARRGLACPASASSSIRTPGRIATAARSARGGWPRSWAGTGRCA